MIRYLLSNTSPNTSSGFKDISSRWPEMRLRDQTRQRNGEIPTEQTAKFSSPRCARLRGLTKREKTEKKVVFKNTGALGMRGHLVDLRRVVDGEVDHPVLALALSGVVWHLLHPGLLLALTPRLDE